MRKHIIVFAISAIISAGCLLGGCVNKIEPGNKVLARVSNKTVTSKDLKDKVSKLPPYYQEMIKRDKKRFVDELILEMLLYEEAVRKNLESDKEVRDILAEAKKKILVTKLIKDEVEDKIVIEDGEVREMYENRKDDFKTPELWRASHILVGTEADAKSVLEELSAGASFEELAKTRSMDATASRGGDIGYFRKGQLVPEFESACLNLNVGELSGVVHTQFGYHVIKLTDRKEPAAEDYNKVKRAIEEELKKNKRTELFDKLVSDLKKKYDVKIDEDAVKNLEIADKDNKESQ